MSINSCMKDTNYLQLLELFAVSGYIRMKTRQYISKCIIQMIYKYCGKILPPFSERMKDTRNKQLSNIIATDNICNTLQNVRSLISFPNNQYYWLLDTSKKRYHSSGFKKRCDEKMNELFYETGRRWIYKYLSNDIDIIKLTEQIEIICQEAKHNYTWDMTCNKIVIPEYANAILSKHHSSQFDELVNVLSRAELKRIYNLFRKANLKYAKELNDAFKLKSSKRQNENKKIKFRVLIT
eukprot:541376_1